MASHDLNDLPLTVGSVVWCQGHPWVLDGEPGADDPERRMWVGLNVNSAPWVRTRGNMAAVGFVVLWRSDHLSEQERTNA